MTILNEAFDHDARKSHELLIVDSDIADADILLSGLARPMPVVALTVGIDPVAQIVQALSQHFGVRKLHILAHGEAGALRLAGTCVDTAYLDAHSEALATVKFALARPAQISLWACSVGEGVAGKAFVSALSAHTGADVFAAEGPVGTPDIGGTWSIGTPSPFMQAAEAAYPHTLPTFDFQSGVSGISSSVVTQTVDGVQVTFTLSNAATWTYASGAAFDGFALALQPFGANNRTDSVTVSFDIPVTITSFDWDDFLDIATSDIVFTPSTGTAITISAASANGGTTVTPSDWTDISSFTVTSAADFQAIIDTIVFIPSNRAAEIGGDTTGSVGEDSTDTIGGALTISDADGNGDESFNADTITGSYGELTIDANGDWVYDLDETLSGVQALSGSDTLQDTLAVTSADGTSQNIVITIDGANDAATFGGNLTGSLGEDTDSVGGTATVADVDASEGTFAADTISGTYGDLTIATNGSWTYDLDETDATVQGLLSGDTLQDTITVASDDGTTQDIVITINGANDGATFGGDLTGSLNEDTDTLVGTATVSDVDAGQGNFGADTVTGTYGDLTIDANGDWIYDLDETDATVQGLASSDTLQDTLTVQSVDGTTQDIVITIDGANDAATFGGNLTGSLSEDTDSVGGTATVADVDAGQGTFDADTISGTYGDLVIAANGDWVYDLDEADSAVQGLTAGDTLQDTLTVASDDGTAQDIIVTISGVDDAPSFGGDLTGAINEDGTTTTGTATVSDADTGQDSFSAETIGGANGTLEIAANGDWTYTVDNSDSAVQGLAAGDTLADTITVESADGTTQDIVVTITGVNDVPTSSGGAVSGREDQRVQFSESDFNFEDVDTSDTLDTIEIVDLPSRGTLRLSGEAVEVGDVIAASDISDLDYRPASNFNGTVSFDYRVSDGTASSGSEATMTIDIASVNDAPRNLRLDDTTVSEVVPGAVVGILSASDPDSRSLRYSVSDDRFMVSDDDQLMLKPGAALDYETEPTVTLTVTVSDSLGASSSEEFDITVIDVWEQTGGADDDVINGHNEDDFIESGSGDDRVSAGDGRDTIDGGVGNDDIDGGGDDDLLRGGQGHDLVNSGSGNDLVWAGRGDDGDDTVNGDEGADTLGGGVGDDLIDGGKGDDVIYGREGEDTLFGGEGNDLIYNGEGSDSVNGGNGNDTLWGSAGDHDTLTGGDGEDTFAFTAISGDDVVADFDATEDILDLRFVEADFGGIGDVQAAATETSQNGADGLLIDLGGNSVFLVGLTLDDLSDATITL
ncbi:MAG: DUF4347 domain-containing protein [Alphaproteobacteria bacterium]|nr:DUF4347 domain-containing protein [Alphaproteobacteria bacterium]